MDTLILNTLESGCATQLVVCQFPDNEEINSFLFSEEEKEIFAKMKSGKRRAEFVGTRLALEKLLGYKPHIQHDADGKPFLESGKVNFSLSHSKNLVAAITHSEKSVGVDIEELTPKIERLAARFLTEKELNFSQKSENKALFYTICWTAKEAAYKIIGKSAVDFQTMEIEPFEVNNEGKIILIHLEKEFALHYKILKNSVLTYICK
jgi:phosphopantetheine--protein transferase-like protein